MGEDDECTPEERESVLHYTLAVTQQFDSHHIDPNATSETGIVSLPDIVLVRNVSRTSCCIEYKGLPSNILSSLFDVPLFCHYLFPPRIATSLKLSIKLTRTPPPLM